MNDFIDFVNNLCPPAKLYFVIVLLNGVFFIKDFHKVRIGLLLSSAVLILLMGSLIAMFGNYLCNAGYSFIVWLFVLLPLTTLVSHLSKRK